MNADDAKKVLQDLTEKPVICGDRYIETDSGYVITSKEYFKNLEKARRNKT